MKTLVIAEKPSVARDIARVLGCSKKENGALEGNKYIVTWALGHLVTLKDPEDYDKKYKEWNMAVLPMMPEKLQIKVIPQTGKQYHAVTTQLARKDVNEIVIATDAGREGELVARWILDKAHNQKPCKRLWISSVTDKAIREGFANLKDAKEYDNLYRAAVSRAEADWLVGINATRALTCKYNAQLSCGRVQTPTLAMIAQREQEIREFVPKPYYTVTAAAGGVVYTWKDEKSGGTRISDPEKAKQIAEKAKRYPLVLQNVEKKKKQKEAPLLYDLTELQRDVFMKEIRSYTVELIDEIKTEEGTFRHDNLTNKKCPNCGKRLLAVNGKNAKLLVCQDRECGYRETVSRTTNARCPVCHKRMEMIGKGEDATFVCACGHKERMTKFQERRKKEGGGVTKRDVAAYMKKQKKEAEEPVNNAFAAALKGIKL